MCTMTVEYDSSNAVAVNFINEMKKLGVFKIVFENTTPKAKKTTKTPKKEKPNHLLEELTNIKNNYPDNWDGEGAKAINPVVYANCYEIISKCDTKILDNWEIDLDDRGCVVFTANNHNGSIKIMGNTMAYFLSKGKKHLMNKCVKYSVLSFSNLLKLWEHANNEN